MFETLYGLLRQRKHQRVRVDKLRAKIVCKKRIAVFPLVDSGFPHSTLQKFSELFGNYRVAE